MNTSHSKGTKIRNIKAEDLITLTKETTEKNSTDARVAIRQAICNVIALYIERTMHECEEYDYRFIGKLHSVPADRAILLLNAEVARNPRAQSEECARVVEEILEKLRGYIDKV